MEARAVARYVRVSPRKARLVVDLIRGKSVADAQAILRFSPRAAAEVVEKVLNSAVANAEQNLHVKSDDLVVGSHVRGRGSDPQAHPAARHGPRVPHQQAHQPHHRRRQAARGGVGAAWDRRSIRSACVWVSPRTGVRAGTRARTTRRPSRDDSQSAVPDEASAPRRAAQDRDRAQGRQDDHRAVDRPSGHRHRQEGRRGRRPAQGAREDHRRHRRGEHRRDQAPRARRRADRAERRRAARRPRRVPPRHAQGGRLRDEERCAGHPRSSAPAASAAPRWVAASGTARVACRCTPCAPRSTTAPPIARTTMGAIGVKVWVYHGEVLPGQDAPESGARGRASVASAPSRSERGDSDRCFCRSE